MKRLFLIGGTMGVGKTSVCQELKRRLDNAVFLDGDWCWDADPFQVNDETKAMVLNNICFLLNQFLHCLSYNNILFCWVLHEQATIDLILSRLDLSDCDVAVVSLVCGEDILKKRLQKDVQEGKRTSDVISRSISRIPLYHDLDTIKINTEGKSIAETAEIISCLLYNK